MAVVALWVGGEHVVGDRVVAYGRYVRGRPVPENDEGGPRRPAFGGSYGQYEVLSGLAELVLSPKSESLRSARSPPEGMQMDLSLKPASS